MAATAPWGSALGLPNFEATADPQRLLRVDDAETLQRLGALIDAVDPDGVVGAAAPILAARALSEA